MLRSFYGLEDSSPKSNLAKEKESPRQTLENGLSQAEIAPANRDREGKGIEPLPLARTRTTRLHVRPPVTSPLNGKLAITFLSHDRASRGRLLVPVGSYTQKTQAIGQ